MDKNILRKYVEGNATPEETVAVVDWLDADPAHVKEFMALHKLYDISVMNQPVEHDIVAVRRPVSRLRRIVVRLARIAAVVVVALGCKALVDVMLQADAPVGCQVLYVPYGQRAELMLPDSTRVWLNANTRLTYPVHFGKNRREVQLDGEAFFDVWHNAESPFVVKTGKVDVKVLGTAFDVEAYSRTGSIDVSLLRGSVELKSDGCSRTYRMHPGEHVKYENGHYVSMPIDDTDCFRWKEGILSFSNMPVADILSKLQLYYDVRIKVEKKAFLKERYSGKFRQKDGVEHVLRVLKLEHGFKYTKDNENNLITIK